MGIAFALTGTRWYKYDDLNKKREIANCLQEIRPLNTTCQIELNILNNTK